MPKRFSAEAANTVVYLLNQLPTHALSNRTTFEAWYGYRPSIAHLKVFSCVCYVHILNSLRDKLHQKAKLGVFVRYSAQAKAYRIYLLSKKKVVVSQDVVFDEVAS